MYNIEFLIKVFASYVCIAVCASCSPTNPIESNDTIIPTEEEKPNSESPILDIFSIDSLDQHCVIQIYSDNKGLLKFSENGYCQQYLGIFNYDSIGRSYEFIPEVSFSTDICKSFRWGEPYLLIGSKKNDQVATAHVHTANFDTTFNLIDTISELDLSKSYVEKIEDVTVEISFDSSSRLQSISHTVPYFTTGICTRNIFYFNKAEIKIVSNDIFIHYLNKKSNRKYNEVLHFKISK